MPPYVVASVLLRWGSLLFDEPVCGQAWLSKKFGQGCKGQRVGLLSVNFLF